MVKLSSKQTMNIFITSMTILAFVAFVGLGFILWQHNLPKDVSSQRPQTTQQVSIASRSGSYSGWQSYMGVSGGYHLLFPADWRSDVPKDKPSSASGVVGFEPINSSVVIITVSSFKAILAPKDFVTANSSPHLLDSNENSINGNGTYYYKDGDGTYIDRSYVIYHQGIIVTVTMTEVSKALSVDNSKYVAQFDLLAKSITF